MFAPDVVEPVSGTYYLLVGTGDREKPLSVFDTAAGISNYFFLVKDKPGDAGWLAGESSNCGGDAVICLASLLEIPSTGNPSDTDLAAKKGWYLPLTSTEQVVTSAITVFDTVTFSTHQPATSDDEDDEDADICGSNLGETRVYNIAFKNAAPGGGNTNRSEEVSGGGLPPSPVAGMVTLDNGQTLPFVIGASPDSPLEGKLPTSTSISSAPKGRVYWYIEQ